VRDTLYVEALAAPDTIDTLPEKTLKAMAERGEVGEAMDPGGGDAEKTLAEFAAAGIDVDAIAEQLQVEGATSFVKSWNGLMQRIADKGGALGRPAKRA
jgi:transaldolase